MNLRHLLSAAFMALAVASTTYCSGGGPTTPPDPPPPLPDIVPVFPTATMRGDTLFVTEGDPLDCVVTLVPPSSSLVVGWKFDGAAAICSNRNLGSSVPPKLMYFASASVIVPSGDKPHVVEILLQSGSGSVLKRTVFTLVVVPRPASPFATG